MATDEECRAALERLAARLATVDGDEHRHQSFDRSMSCFVPDLKVTFSGALARLPKAGVWMVWVKRLFALLMIGAAEYYFIPMGQVLL